MRLVYLAEDDTYYGEYTRVPRPVFEAAMARLVAGGIEARVARTRLLDEWAWLPFWGSQAGK